MCVKDGGSTNWLRYIKNSKTWLRNIIKKWNFSLMPARLAGAFGDFHFKNRSHPFGFYKLCASCSAGSKGLASCVSDCVPFPCIIRKRKLNHNFILSKIFCILVLMGPNRNAPFANRYWFYSCYFTCVALFLGRLWKGGSILVIR